MTEQQADPVDLVFQVFWRLDAHERQRLRWRIAAPYVRKGGYADLGSREESAPAKYCLMSKDHNDQEKSADLTSHINQSLTEGVTKATMLEIACGSSPEE